MLKHHSIARKLFIITSLIIIGLLSLVLVFESLFFESFYRHVKQHEQETAITKLTGQLEVMQADEQAIAYTIGSAMNEYDASIALLNEDYRIKQLDIYVIHLVSGEQTIKVIINEEGLRYGDLPVELLPGDKLVVDGIFMDQHNAVLHPVHFNPETVEPEIGLVRVQGTITSLLLPEQRSYNPMYQDMLISNVLADWKPWELTDIQSAQSMTMQWRDAWSGVQYIATLAKMSDIDSYVIMLSSLQPVDEAISILRKYVLVLFPFIVLIVIILAVVYSRYIARPLVKINAFAEKLAQLQFSATPPIQSKDEYGQLSQHLVTLSHNLEKALEEVTERNEQLQVEISKKIHLEELRKELVANIAHELKTPLAVLKGYAEGLQDGIASHKQEAYLAHIVRETDVMNELIMDLLELSKYEVNAITLKPAHFHIIRLVQDEVDALAIQLTDKNLHVKIDTTALSNLNVIGDRKRIKQVVVNVLSNAVRHAKAGSTLRITLTTLPLNKVEVRVYNEGDAIPVEHLQLIWEKFYRVEQARDRRSGGTGLGLTIARHILQLHESQFGAKNTEHGVEFYFTLKEGSANHDNEK
ncbi:sensor histidine kinase [Paenibacillus septentrionalis]|uniref:sensor histidine kinase n=1 Tax=Paenibacillus septentrionalis TaxID=429342 RepID=UPI00362B3AF7